MKASEAYLHGIDVIAAPERDLEVLFDEAPKQLPAPVSAVEPQQMRSQPNKSGGRTVDGGGPPLDGKGALVPFEPPVRLVPKVKRIKSEIEDVSDEAWTKFVMLMRTSAYGDVSATGALGAWEMRPKRLADLKLMANVRQVAGPGRTAWAGEFVGDLTQRKFLESPEAQYMAFAESMRRYAAGLKSGEISRASETEDMTTSGMLAILHRSGPRGLKNWSDRRRRFSDTVDLFDKVNGVF